MPPSSTRRACDRCATSRARRDTREDAARPASAIDAAHANQTADQTAEKLSPSGFAMRRDGGGSFDPSTEDDLERAERQGASSTKVCTRAPCCGDRSSPPRRRRRLDECERFRERFSAPRPSGGARGGASRGRELGAARSVPASRRLTRPTSPRFDFVARGVARCRRLTARTSANGRQDGSTHGRHFRVTLGPAFKAEADVRADRGRQAGQGVPRARARRGRLGVAALAVSPPLQASCAPSTSCRSPSPPASASASSAPTAPARPRRSRCSSGLLHPTSGTVRVAGFDPRRREFDVPAPHHAGDGAEAAALVGSAARRHLRA